MNASQPTAALRAHAPDLRAPARNARATAEARGAEESLPAHARRLLRAKLSAAANAVLGACIGWLQRMSKTAGSATDGRADEDRRGPRHEVPGGRRDAAAPSAAAEAPAPGHRLRSFLVHVSVLLAGGMGGTALGYNLLAKLLHRQFAENHRLVTINLKHAKSAASVRKQLEEAQAKRIEAEKTLEASLAESAQSSAEKQKRLDEAENRLAAMLAADQPRSSRLPAPATRGRAAGAAVPARTGDCNVDGGNISGLKDCINGHSR